MKLAASISPTIDQTSRAQDGSPYFGAALGVGWSRRSRFNRRVIQVDYDCVYWIERVCGWALAYCRCTAGRRHRLVRQYRYENIAKELVSRFY